MPRFVLVLRAVLCVVLLVASTALPAQGTPVGPWHTRLAATVRDTMLANGLTVIVAENHSIPLATVEVAFRTGAAVQAPGEEGMAHVLEHLLFRAFGDNQAFTSEVANINGTYNGSTSDEEVNYFITAPSKGTLSAIRLLARLVREPPFNDRDLSAERKIVSNELARMESDARSALRSGLGQRLWGDAWSRKDPGGTSESIGRIRIDKLKAMFVREYVPANAAVIISGDVPVEETLAEAVRRFAEWKPPAASTAKPELPAVQPTAVIQTFAVAAVDERLVTVAIQWPGPSVRQSPIDALAADVFAAMVNSSTSPARLRLTSAGFVHSITFESNARDLRGPLTLTVVMSPSLVDQALPVLRAEIARFVSPEYLGGALLVVGRKQVTMSAEHWLERGSSVAFTIGQWWSVADLAFFRDYGDAVSRVDVSQVRTFLNRYIIEQPFVVGALAPPAEVEHVRRSLAATFATRAP